MPTIDTRDTALLRALQRTGELPLHDLFSELAELWHTRNPELRNKDLAALLGTRPQAVSQWKSGSDPRRRPPWSAIVLLLHLTKRQLTVHPAGVRLTPLRRWKHPASD